MRALLRGLLNCTRGCDNGTDCKETDKLCAICCMDVRVRELVVVVVVVVVLALDYTGVHCNYQNVQRHSRKNLVDGNCCFRLIKLTKRGLYFHIKTANHEIKCMYNFRPPSTDMSYPKAPLLFSCVFVFTI